MWTTVVLSLPQQFFKFALNTTTCTDTLPHNMIEPVQMEEAEVVNVPPLWKGTTNTTACSKQLSSCP